MLKDYTKIDWLNPQEKISQYFTVKEATWLPSWQVYHQPDNEQKANICKVADKMDTIREYLERPIHVTVWIRPSVTMCDNPIYRGRSYNAAIGGAVKSAHITGEAVDFHVSSFVCDEIRYLLQSKLEDFNIRLEDKPRANWVHVDIRKVPPDGNRFFKP